MRVAAVLVVVAATTHAVAPPPRRLGLAALAALAAATKTVDDISKAAPTYDWHAARQRVRDAMMHEVNAYSNVTSARLAIRTALRDRQRAVWLVSGRILVHEDFLRKGGMKNNLHARFVKSLIKESSKELRNFVYIFDQGATGGTRACDEHIPRLVIAKQHEAVHEGLTEKQLATCGVLVPNPYFGDLNNDWPREFNRLTALADKRSWQSRDERMFWRGKIGSPPKWGNSVRTEVVSRREQCWRDAGNYNRARACDLTVKHPSVFDIKWTVSCEPRKIATRAKDPCADLLPQPRYPMKCRALRGSFTEHPEYTKYQFLLDLPGSTTGSYSRNLNHLWLMGAIVGIWHGPMTEPHGAAPCGNQPVI